jgi:branched-chain amino acid transport system substrate-binding protein
LVAHGACASIRGRFARRLQRREGDMRIGLIGLAAAAALAVAPAAAQEKLKIGFINTFSGGLAIYGKHQKDAVELAMEHLGGKIGGLETEIIYGDDEVKPDVGLQVAQKMVQRDKVQFVTGIIWSNVLAAVQAYVLREGVWLITTNAGWSEMAGKNCHENFFSTSWNNDGMPEAMGKLMNDDGVKNVFMLSPNYQAGKDMLNGFQRFYKGGVKGQILTKLGQTDYAAEISQARASGPDALFLFLPGPMGISFIKQWAASGLADKIKVYTVFTIDELTFGGLGDAAIGTYHTNYWSPDLPFPQNKKFVADFEKKYNYTPSNFSAQAYDMPLFLDSGIRAVKGDLKNKNGIRAALRKADYPSTRGPYKYNINHMPIQNYYKREVIRGEDGKPKAVVRATVFKDHKDAYSKDCKMKW